MPTPTLDEIQKEIDDPSFIGSETRVYQILEALIANIGLLRTENATLGKKVVDLRENNKLLRTTIQGFLDLAEQRTWPSYDRRAEAQRLLTKKPG